ncbi:MAG: ATP-binding protein [Opitutaceae bacterium]
MNEFFLHPFGWEAATGHLYFASAFAWLISAGLAWCFAGVRPAGSKWRVWLPVSAIQLGCALGSACLLLEQHASVVSSFAFAAPLARWSWLLAMIGAAFAFPRPCFFAERRKAWTALVVTLAAAGVASQIGGWPATNVLQPVIVAAGLWLLAHPCAFERAPSVTLSVVWGHRFVGVLTLSAGLGDAGAMWNGVQALAVSAAGETPFKLAHAAVLALVANGACVALWVAYLREHTLPRVRLRTRFFGLKPSLQLPVLMLVTILGGVVLGESAGRGSWNKESRRMQEELETAVRLVEWPVRPGSPGGFDVADQRRWTEALNRLVEGRKSFAAASLFAVREQARMLVAPEPSRPGAVSASFLTEARVAHWLRASAAGNTSEIRVSTSGLDGMSLLAAPVDERASRGAVSVLVVLNDARERTVSLVFASLSGSFIVLLLGSVTAGALIHTVRVFNESELRSLKEQAEADNHARGEFLAMVSHEVRTPLQSVLGYAELAASEPLTPAAMRHLGAIRSQGAILLRLVQDILDYSAMQTGEVKLARDAVIVADLLEDIRRAFHDRAAIKGLNLVLQAREGVPRILEMDRTRVSQILLNLVGNALKFTVRGGISVTVAPAHAGAEENGRLLLDWTVADTGPGIPSQQLRKIFEPFRKLRNAGTAGGGLGLGLAICEQIARRMGGTITARSVFGRGATFVVRLPVKPYHGVEPAGDARSAQPTVPIHALSGLRILLIDDNAYVREQLREALRMMGASVWSRPDGGSALAAARRRRFDVALVDLKLPDMDGCALAADLRRAHSGPDKPWIAGMSAGISDKRLERALQAGLDDFLLKPISMPGLVETIKLSPVADRIAVEADSRVEAFGSVEDSRDSFFSEAAAIIDRMDVVLKNERGEHLAAEAHYLANGCLVMGLEAAFAACREIEELAEAGAYNGVPARLDDLRLALSPPLSDKATTV